MKIFYNDKLLPKKEYKQKSKNILISKKNNVIITKKEEKMEKEQLLLTMIKSYVQQEPWQVEESDLTLEFLQMLESQDLLALLYYCLLNNKIQLASQENMATLKAIYISSIAKDSRFNNAKQKIQQILQKHSIKHCFFKGIDLKSLYGDTPEVRSMGDIDLLISDQDRRVLISELFDKDASKMALSEVEEIEVDGVSVELHSKINYFDKMIVDIDDILQDNTMDTTQYLFLLVTHLIKHIMTSGVGIRQFMDIALYIKANFEQIDWVLFEKMLEYSQKQTTANYVLAFVQNALGVQVGVNLKNVEYDSVFEQSFLKFIANNGVFGFDDVGNMGSNKVLKYKDKKFPKLRTLLYYAFPPLSALQCNYPRCMKYKILIPYYYICNIFRRLFLSHGKGKAIFKSIQKSDLNDERNNLLKKLEIFEKQG